MRQAGLLQLPDQVPHLFHRKGLARPHGAVADHTDQGLLLPRLPATLLGQLVQDFNHGLADVTPFEHGWHRSQQVGFTPEGLNLEAQFGQGLQVLGHGRLLARREFQSQGGQELLRGYGHAGLLGGEAFVEHPFVGRVLVYEVHAPRPLGDDVGLAQLAQHPQHGEPGPQLRGDGC